jgi:hypothetical protein
MASLAVILMLPISRSSAQSGTQRRSARRFASEAHRLAVLCIGPGELMPDANVADSHQYRPDGKAQTLLRCEDTWIPPTTALNQPSPIRRSVCASGVSAARSSQRWDGVITFATHRHRFRGFGSRSRRWRVRRARGFEAGVGEVLTQKDGALVAGGARERQVRSPGKCAL